MARWQALPLEHQLYWLLRLGVIGCFIGHGAYGFLTKEAWVPFFAVVGIDRTWAYRLMPWVGAMDVGLGVLMMVIPMRSVMLHLAIWGLWTAALRPLSGDTVWECVERAGNYGVPLAFLILAGTPRALRHWFAPVRPSSLAPLTLGRARLLQGILRCTTCLLLFGHGALGALHTKPELTAHYASLGLQNVVVGSFTVTQVVGGLEMLWAIVVCIAPLPSLLIGICLWKMGTEALFMTSGALPFEWIERAGSYIAPLALSLLSWTKSRWGDI